MDDLPGLLARDFGIRPQGKSAPMAPPAGSGGPPRFSQPRSSPPVGSFSATSKASSLPVYDKPVYDDDVFDGIPGMKSSTSGRHDDVFASVGSSGASAPPMGDFLESLGRSPSEAKGSGRGRFGASKEGLAGFEGLIPGFVGSSPTQRSKSPETNYQSTSVPPSKLTSNVTNDPFVVLETSTSANSSSGLFTDPLEQISRPMSSGSTNINASPISGRLFDDINGFGGLKKSTPSYSSEKKENGQDESPLSAVQNAGHQDPFADLEPHTKSSTKTSKNVPKRPTNGYRGTNHTFFQKPSKAAESFEDISRSAFSSSEAKLKPHERNATADLSPKLNEHLEAADNVWLAVSEIPLFTQPTSSPSPSRPPPPLVIKLSSSGRISRASVGINFKGKGSSSFNQSSQSYENSTQNSGASPIDELEDFAMGRPQAFANENSEFLHNEDNFERSSAAAASAAVMKEAMDKAEAKFKHAKEARERERDAKLATNREASQQERLYREKEQRDREEKEREEKRFERERELELERAREREREREKQVVGRVNREARERAASEALSKFERAAFQRAAAEARERAERAAVEKTSAQARERNAAQVQERHAAQVRERGASQAQEKHQNNENDLESIFGMKQRATTVENFFDAQVQSKPASNATRRSSSTSSSTIQKASSTTNIVDDLTSVFGAPPSSGEFQEVEGESEERRRAKMERHLRTRDRATKALAEMNERDVQTKWEQEERLRISETLDSEIKRWAAGKEGNLRALLSTLQYVLWPECGWQPVSLTDLITSASVKKVYRKATLCIHPDKVQQKGANLQQKYTAEKVFDLLKEAWNKFNSEELF